MAIQSKLIIGSLVAATSLSAFILSSATVNADEPYSETYTKSALIRVQGACTMAGTVTAPHTKSIPAGTYASGIGETVVSTVCNDAGGFAIYAIGYTGDTDGNTNMINDTDSTKTIATGTATSGDTSNWAMKLNPVESQYGTPIIENNYDNYNVIPNNYVKVASYPSATSTSNDVSFTTEYAAYVNLSQVAGSYTGKVKYAMVHPSSEAPEEEVVGNAFDNAFAAAGKTKDASTNKYKMQDMSASICNNVNSGDETELVDIRDNSVYRVGKLLDGRCWMQDNLTLNLADSDVKATIINNPSYTNADQATLTNLYSDRSVPGMGPSYVFDGVIIGPRGSNYYSVPLIIISEKDNKPTTYQGVDEPLASFVDSGSWKTGIYYNFCAASAGSYCYGSYTSPGSDAVDRLGTAIDAEYDICPAGWRLPTASSYEATARPDGGEYQSVYEAYANIDDGDIQYNRFRKALYLPLSGRAWPSASDQGNSGYFWSSTAAGSGSSYMYSLHIDTMSVYPQFSNNEAYRSSSISVRCITKTGTEP